MIVRVLFSLFLFSIIVSAKIVVASSIEPISSLIKSIAKDRVEVVTIVKAGSSPHTYEPKVSQMRAIERAKIYFAIGVEFEKSWLDKFKNQNSSLEIVYLDSNVTKFLTKFKSNIIKEDPHIWLSPKNMLIISNDILHSLLKVDKQNRDFYLQNYKKLVANIQNLDKEIKKILSPLPKSSKFMVFHPSWGYFARDYNLLQLPIEIEGKSPKPSQLIKLIKIAKKDGIKVIIAEPEFSTKSADILAKEIGAKVIKLSPLSANWQESLLTLAKSISKGYSK